jgi:hypothetical protein
MGDRGRNTALLLLVLVGGVALFGMGGGARVPAFVVLPLVVVVGFGGAALLRGRPITDVAWLGGDRIVSFVAPTRPAPVHVAASPRRTVLALGRAEAKAWLSSPWFATGLAFCVLELVLFGWVWADEDVSSWPQFIVVYPAMAFPLTGMAVVGAHFAVTRSRRDRAEEIFAACPADEATRTAAHVLSGWVPSAGLLTSVVALTLLVPIRDTHLYGFRWLLLGDVLAAVVLGWCGAALGVALARWLRFALVPVVALFFVLLATLNIGNLGEPHWSNLRQLSTWPRYPDHDLVFTDRHVWSHLAWLVALGALMAVIALLHARRDRRMISGAAVVALAVAVSGLVAARPISAGSAARLASLVADPAAHQTCRDAGGASVCAYRGYGEYAGQVAEHVRPVAARIADVSGGTAQPVTLRQHFNGRVAVLGPEVAAALRARGVGRPDLALGYETGRGSMHRARLVVAASALGLPTSPVGGRPYVAAGQARGVVALWLAAQGLPAQEQTHLASYHFEPLDHPEDYELTAFDLGNAWPQTCDGDAPGVVWSEPDLIAARRLLARPVAEVAGVVRVMWPRLTNPGVSTNELLAALQLGSVAAPPPIEARSFPC